MTQSHHGCLSGEDLESLWSLGAGSPVAQVAQAGLCALVPLCLPDSWKQCLGGPCPLPTGLPTWAKVNTIAGEEVFWLCQNSSSQRKQAMLGKKEVDQKA